MKKFTILLAGLLFLGGVAAYAQEGHIVIRAGYNYGNINVGNVQVQDMINGHSGWQVGAGYQTAESYGFSFQPEVVYKQTHQEVENYGKMGLRFVEIPLNVQWGPDLKIVPIRPFIFAGPYFGFKLPPQFDKNWGAVGQTITDSLKKTEWGVDLGIGINFWKFQIAGKYNWNIGQVANAPSTLSDNNLKEVLGGSLRTFEISVGLLF